MPGCRKKTSIIKYYQHNLQQIMFLYNVDTYWHSHPCFQLTVTLHKDPFTIAIGDNTQSIFGVIIPPNLSHKLSVLPGACFNVLVEPGDKNYHQLLHLLATRKELYLNDKISRYIARIISHAICKNQPISLLPIMKLLGGHFCPGKCDRRINKALSLMKYGLDSKLSSKEIADGLSLSESHFLHLFRNNTKSNFRGYLLWQRLQSMLGQLSLTTSLTTLAHTSGFADSAHLSRTCKRFLGLTPSRVRSIITQSEVIERP